jgi:hypothetical protein
MYLDTWSVIVRAQHFSHDWSLSKGDGAQGKMHMPLRLWLTICEYQQQQIFQEVTF